MWRIFLACCVSTVAAAAYLPRGTWDGGVYDANCACWYDVVMTNTVRYGPDAPALLVTHYSWARCEELWLYRPGASDERRWAFTTRRTSGTGCAHRGSANLTRDGTAPRLERLVPRGHEAVWRYAWKPGRLGGDAWGYVYFQPLDSTGSEL